MNQFIGKISFYWSRVARLMLLLMLLVTVLGGYKYVSHAAGSNPHVVYMNHAAAPVNTHIAYAAKSGDWTMYLHDAGRSSYNPYETVINPGSAGSLKPRWIGRVGGAAGVAISTQPVVSNGLVYWGSWDGYEHATNPSNPANDVWTTFLGQTAYNADCSPPQLGVASTATVQSIMIGTTLTRVLFVGGGDGTFYALNALTGQKIWSIPFGLTS